MKKKEPYFIGQLYVGLFIAALVAIVMGIKWLFNL